jgi:peptidoglycan/LPS O-acetylase OafA/YrhL
VPINSDRIFAIDGLRGLAAIAVVFIHWQPAFGLGSWPNTWGQLPVELFFIISGYIISRQYGHFILNGNISHRIFLINRISRLWPIHTFSLFLILGLELYFYAYLGKWHIINPEDTVSAFLANLFLIQSITPFEGATWNKPGWSVLTELAVNAIWVLSLITLVWKPRIAIILVLGCASLLVTISHTTNIPPGDTFLGFSFYTLTRGVLGFSLGYLIYYSGMKLKFPNLTAIITIIFFIIGLIYYEFTSIYYFDFLCILIIFPLLILLAIDPNNFLSNFLENPLLLFLGTISYSVYLLHTPIKVLIESLLIHKGLGIFPAPYMGFFLLFIVLLCSTLSWHLIEKPGMRLIRKIAKG